MNLDYTRVERMSNSLYEDSKEKKGCIQFMQMNVTRIGSIRDQCADVRGYSIQILDNVSTRDYARRSRTNWGAITSGIITVISKTWVSL